MLPSSDCRFKTSNNDHIIEVHLYDDIDFVCPHNTDDDEYDKDNEYYLIHQVSHCQASENLCPSLFNIDPL